MSIKMIMLDHPCYEVDIAEVEVEEAKAMLGQGYFPLQLVLELVKTHKDLKEQAMEWLEEISLGGNSEEC